MKPSTAERLPNPSPTVSDVGAVGRPKTRKPKPGEPIQISLTLDGALVVALDEEADRLAAERPGLSLSRADVIRMALFEHVNRLHAARESKREGTALLLSTAQAVGSELKKHVSSKIKK